MKTLDSVVGRRKLAAPILLKAEVQGYELGVLCSANETILKTEVIHLADWGTAVSRLRAADFESALWTV